MQSLHLFTFQYYKILLDSSFNIFHLTCSFFEKILICSFCRFFTHCEACLGFGINRMLASMSKLRSVTSLARYFEILSLDQELFLSYLLRRIHQSFLQPFLSADLLREEKDISALSSPHTCAQRKGRVRTSEKTASMQAKEGSLTANQPWHLKLKLPASRTVSINFCCLSHSLYYFVKAAQADYQAKETGRKVLFKR